MPAHAAARMGDARMDINRNQFFMAGLVLLFLGLQFRATESVVLTKIFSFRVRLSARTVTENR